jgi:hypothetical protein
MLQPPASNEAMSVGTINPNRLEFDLVIECRRTFMIGMNQIEEISHAKALRREDIQREGQADESVAEEKTAILCVFAPWREIPYLLLRSNSLPAAAGAMQQCPRGLFAISVQ